MNDADHLEQQRTRLARRVEQLRERFPDDQVVHDATSDLETALEEITAATDQLAQESNALTLGHFELSDEREAWRKLFDFAPGAMVVTDKAGIIVEYNRRALDLLQVRSAGTRPVLLALRLASASRPGFQRMLRNPVVKGQEPLLVMLARPDAEEFRGELRCAVVSSDRLLWLISDVSEAERARELLESAIAHERAAAVQLRTIDAMRRAFVLSVSHDLNAPIAAIAGLTHLLQTDDLDENGRSRVVAQLGESARTTVGMLQDLLDYERAEEAVTPRQSRKGDIATIVRRAAGKANLDDHPLELDLPPTLAHADPTIVERIVSNLVRNAVQHTPPGTTIWVRCRREPDGVLLVVEDDGPGIPADLLPTVFDLFQRARSGGASPNGLGVGLALVRRFAQLHGGYARVEDRPGGGASFHVLLGQ